MRFGVLVHRSWRDLARVKAYVAKAAEKHPGAVMLSFGEGLGPYAAERAALDAGLRVAAFRSLPREPEPRPSMPRRRPPDDPEEVLPAFVLPRDVFLYELEPGNREHYDRLWHPGARVVATAASDETAAAAAILLVGRESAHVVAFSDVEWPELEGVHRLRTA